MGTTSVFPGLVAQNGGQLLTPNYYGMWGNKVWFVDYDNGTVGATGDAPDKAQKHLQTILDKAGEWDTIYIRPRDPDSTGGDPQAIIPASSTNWSFAYTVHGLSIIGTGNGGGKAAANQTRLQACSTAGATATLNAKAPFCTFENLTFRRGSSTLAGLEISTDASTEYAFSSTVNRCLFWKIGSTATSGALYMDAAWHCNVLNSWFEECAIGINLGSSNSVPVGVVIQGCQFNGADSSVDCDIYAGGGATSIWIDRCDFAHDIPALSGGGHLRYIKTGTATGLLSNSTFGSETTTLTTNITISNIDVVNCTYAGGTNFSTY